MTHFPKGFSSCSLNAGIKDDTLDFTIIYSDTRAAAAAMFTKNQFCGAPIVIGKEHVKDGYLQAIAVNSKNANVATGEKGLQDARTMTEAVAAELGIDPSDVLPSSTGVIGVPLPIEKIVSAVPGLKAELRPDGLEQSAKAIMTTDTYPKFRTRKIGEATLAAMAKGSGMIEPNMATMLSYILTDAKIEADDLKAMLQRAVNVSFNSVSVDGDTSTSDTVAIMANGLAGEVNLAEFEAALTDLCIELAKEIARDGEGATKLVEVQVTGADSDTVAKKIGKSIINSPLVKTALFGEDPNWGRIMSTIGNSEDAVDTSSVSVSFADVYVFQDGAPTEDKRAELEEYLKTDEVLIKISLGTGTGAATVWGCDLSYDYVKINGEYTT
ncbi:bifunctional glutamate N-acetyltransferase/amino-acid acetyltransferase ArgJ [Domibacillus sp. PGB-M46]|uniref:bifunctional glutamate N-acetyltransferase/amino-acid acetyltransferase ArgJ n=1 Tax=Domibacillus sp. PGB-M46 TaxID=2910255 RepID=UPI001F55F7A1|nr:bifunctional glutamate N-acetyltransferase/amino-acid acetyltransferase ArgJ [Domibacillus sp. PGB-M46]MCI2254963.1 bifunctional glutamate N-acetyltransferase/amino-acid acetyltransferase ArgJ [Domibacillus sp. PGB-M46]